MKLINVLVIALIFYYLYDRLLKKSDLLQNKNQNKNQNKIIKEDFKMFCDEDIENTNFIKDYLARLNSSSKISQLKYSDFNIPYNFSNNLDNNVLYNTGVKGLKKRLKYEKALVGGVKPVNFKLVKKNYDKDIDPFKQIPNYYYYYKNKDKCTKYRKEKDPLECCENYGDKTRPVDYSLQLIGRWLPEENKIYINWAVDLCQDIKHILIYFKQIADPKKCLVKDDLKLSSFIKYEIPYQKKTFKENLQEGIYHQYYSLDRLVGNFTTNELSKDNKYLLYVGVRFPTYKIISNLVEL